MNALRPSETVSLCVKVWHNDEPGLGERGMSNIYADHEHDTTLAARELAWRDEAGRLPEDYSSNPALWHFDAKSGEGTCPHCGSEFVKRCESGADAAILCCEECGHRSEPAPMAARRRPPRAAKRHRATGSRRSRS